MTTAEGVPSLNAHVELRQEGGDEWYRSLVQDLVDGDIVVASPTDDRGLNVAGRVDDRILVFWRTDRGPFELVADIAEVTTGTLSLWRLHPVGPARGASRRAFFRVRMTAPLELQGEHAGITATLVDLSEGGLRCHVRGDALIPTGTTVELALDLEDARVVATAEVVRREKHDLGQELSMKFLDMPPSEADAVRHQLFVEQRRLRAKGLA